MARSGRTGALEVFRAAAAQPGALLGHRDSARLLLRGASGQRPQESAPRFGGLFPRLQRFAGDGQVAQHGRLRPQRGLCLQEVIHRLARLLVRGQTAAEMRFGQSGADGGILPGIEPVPVLDGRGELPLFESALSQLFRGERPAVGSLRPGGLAALTAAAFCHKRSASVS